MVTVGSRGDHEPFCALAQGLTEKGGHEVDLFVMKDYQETHPLLSSSSSMLKTTSNEPRLTVHSLPFTQNDFYKYLQNPSHGQKEAATASSVELGQRIRFVGVVTDIMADLVFPSTERILDVATNSSRNSDNSNESSVCDLLVTSSLARPLLLAVGQKINRPVAIVNLQPLTPTTRFPHYSHTDWFVNAILQRQQTPTVIGDDDDDGAGANDVQNHHKHKTNSSSMSGEAMKKTYLELERYQFEFLKERLETVYREKLGLDPEIYLNFDVLVDQLSGHKDKVWILNAFPPTLYEQSSSLTQADSKEGQEPQQDDAPHVYAVGALADTYLEGSSKNSWKPPLDLQEFLDETTTDEDANDSSKAKRPICIGFGSMPLQETTKNAIFDAVQELAAHKQRVILVGNALKPSETMTCSTQTTITTKTATTTTTISDLGKHIYFISSVPYPWLLPHCSMMICHGGAGVVNATLRAGIPCLIAPLLGDQFMHAKLLHAKQLGIRVAETLTSLVDKSDILSAIDKAQAGSGVAKASATMGEKIRSRQNGVDACLQLLEEKVAAQ